MCIYERHSCTSVPDMKFVCLNLWLQEVCRDDTNNANANDDDDAQSMIVEGFLVDKPNVPKIHVLHQMSNNPTR